MFLSACDMFIRKRRISSEWNLSRLRRPILSDPSQLIASTFLYQTDLREQQRTFALIHHRQNVMVKLPIRALSRRTKISFNLYSAYVFRNVTCVSSSLVAPPYRGEGV
jgi:hypothetical protein